MNEASGVQDKASSRASICLFMFALTATWSPHCCWEDLKSESERSLPKHRHQLGGHGIELYPFTTAFNKTVIDFSHDLREVKFCHF